MHYLRLLRRPRHVASSPGVLHVELVLTITTDLGDSFLCPSDAISLRASAEVGSASYALSPPAQLQWAPGQRVVKPRFMLPPAAVKAWASGQVLHICIKTAHDGLSAESLDSILESATDPNASGLIMPLRVALQGVADESGGEYSTRRLCWRRLRGAQACLDIDEEIGESIARHVWDAGVVAVAALAGAHGLVKSTTGQHPLLRTVMQMLDAAGPGLNLLELGCGVGILGLGLGAIVSRPCTLLMTDVDEAAGACTLSNLARAEQSPAVKLSYEMLDWEVAKRGQFGPQVRHRPWHLIMLSDCTYNADALPALVGTLTALSAANSRHTHGDHGFITRVLVAMKPRHASEIAFFHLMEAQGWTALVERQLFQLPEIGRESGSVEMHLFEKES
ncbi:hypothetical protein CDD81_6981 [Ophiocordyceps australis]|uniref:Uncharacterized protein n=1 Tax=Ophiocordyceps australis TaxID=1399860 RepID=A0A2C5YFM2_9HYPO|nr:hypothetical protein CDD81_6981 [Ophiocordyceps australis]